MAQKLKTVNDLKRQNKFRMENAVAKIAKDSDLRFFFRTLLKNTGATGSPDADNPHDLAIACGQHQIGSVIIQMLSQSQPKLYAQLLLEDANETLANRNLIEEFPDD